MYLSEALTIAGIGALVIVLLFLLSFRRSGKHGRKVLESISSQIDGELIGGGFWRVPSVRFLYRGQRAVLELMPLEIIPKELGIYPGTGVHFLRIVFKLRSSPTFSLHIRQKETATRILKELLGKDQGQQDREFDKKYLIRTDNDEWARSFVRVGLRKAVNEINSIAYANLTRIVLNCDELEVVMTSRQKAEDSIIRFVEICKQILDGYMEIVK